MKVRHGEKTVALRDPRWTHEVGWSMRELAGELSGFDEVAIKVYLLW